MTTKTQDTQLKVRKRNGSVVDFDKDKIRMAIYKAIVATGEIVTDEKIDEMTNDVVDEITRRFEDFYPNVENIQDIVEKNLMKQDMFDVAKAYIIYRSERAKIRQKTTQIPEHVKKLAAESKQYFRNPLSEFIYYRTYSRWKEDEGRRETWMETVDRYVNFMKENLGETLTEEEYEEVRKAVLNHEAMPSMRLVWSAGKACRKTNVCAYNCSYIAPSQLRDFAEIMYLSMCGCGVGFSVETQNVQLLPIIKSQTGEKLPTHVVKDSKEGWCDALTLALETWYDGKDIDFDFSGVRPAGAKLKTMGGRSSGPGVLKDLLAFAKKKILANQGKRLSNIDVHDIICKIGEVVVMGGVRRTALISLSDLDDEDMRHAKTGQFYLTEPQRAMANNSAVYNYKPTATEFLEEWMSLAKSGTGERGIFNRQGLKHQLPERRWKVFKDHSQFSGTNPCGEIVLRSKQFCNLSEVVCRADDTEESLLRKMKVAAILGTYQSALTKFPYLSEEWKKNCEEERLLGVSLTGQWDCPAVRDPETLRKLRKKAVEVNREYAKKFGISPSTCITCVKPSGTVSQLVDSSSGMHARHSQYYVRRVRIAAHDPLFQMLKDQKFPYKPEVGQDKDSASTYVLEFPIKAPDNAVLRDDLSALDQLEHWKMVKEKYCEHNPSVTVSIGNNEWIETANWLYQYWEILGGLSFLPRTDHVYQLAPYEELTKEEYENMVNNLPEVDFANILAYERDDNTTGAKELACKGGQCEFLPDEAIPAETKVEEEAEVTVTK